MKSLVRFSIISLSALFLLVACGKDDNGGGAGNYNPPFDPVGPFGVQKNYRGTLQITDRSTYQTFLSDSGLCFKGQVPVIPGIWNVGVNSCGWIDRSPVMGLRFDRTDVHVTQGVPGQVIIEALNDWGGQPAGRQPFYTQFYNVNNNTQLEAISNGFAGTFGYNGEIRIVITGKPGDQRLTAQLIWRERQFGTVQLNLFQPFNGFQQPFINQQPFAPYRPF